MSKPFGEPHPPQTADTGYWVNDGLSPGPRFISCYSVRLRSGGSIMSTARPKPDKAKRFTDAELAAEVWKADSDTGIAFDKAYPWGDDDPAARRASNRRDTFERFATMPSYDEAPD